MEARIMNSNTTLTQAASEAAEQIRPMIEQMHLALIPVWVESELEAQRLYEERPGEDLPASYWAEYGDLHAVCDEIKGLIDRL